jgi:hypothetical protein
MKKMPTKIPKRIPKIEKKSGSPIVRIYDLYDFKPKSEII